MQKNYTKRLKVNLCIILLLIANTATAQSLINKIEYYFDSDPGHGNGTPVVISPSTDVDNVFTIDVASLTDGVHILFVRAQDNNGMWSLTNTFSFLKFPGNSNPASITELEYFFNSDPGFGNGTSIPFTPGFDISDTFNLDLPSGPDNSILYVRAKDNKGAWSILYTKTINLCDFNKTEADFSFVKYGNGYSFIDSSKNNTNGKYLWHFGNIATDTIANPFFEFPQGNHTAKLITGVGCRKDSVERSLYVTLESYYPKKAMTGGDIIMKFFGGGLDTNVVVQLIKDGVPFTTYKKLSFDYKQLHAFVDLHNAAGGNYDIKLQYPGGFDTTIVNGLYVDPNFVEPVMDVNLVGPPTIRRNNEWTYYTLTISNKGDVLAKGVPFWVTLPVDVEYEILSNIIIPPGYNGYPLADSIPVYIPLDSLDGVPYPSRMYLMTAPFIDAKETITFKFRVRSSLPNGEFTISYGCNERYFGSPLKYIWGDCWDNAFFLGLNIAGLAGGIPSAGLSVVTLAIVDAVAAGMDVIVDNSIDALNGELSFLSFSQSLANATLSIIGLNAAKDLITLSKVAKVGHTGGSLTSNGSGLVNASSDCFQSQKKVKKLILRVVNSFDPNEIYGPIGYGDQRYINGEGKINYAIEFENLATAGAAAQKVVITDTLDKTKFDLSLFELSHFRIGDSLFVVPAQRQEYTTTVDLRPALNLLVRYNAKLDTATGVLTFGLSSLDPVNGDLIDEDSFDGFLPPNTTAVHPSGTGLVSFSVPLLTGLLQGTIIKNSASIVFDKNPPILTNIWTNELDTVKPIGQIISGARLTDTTLTLTFDGNDNGSGMQGYYLFTSKNNGNYILSGIVHNNSIHLAAEKDTLYYFYTIPFDNVSNKGAQSPVYFIQATPLPLTLGKFYGEQRLDKNHLYFEVIEATGVNKIIIERSKNGTSFYEIGNITGFDILINEINHFIDEQPYTGNNFYRLKILDNDGSVEYSKIILLKTKSEVNVVMYPNPVQKQLELNITGKIEDTFIVTVADALGRNVFQKTYERSSSRGKISISFEDYQSGLYMVVIKDVTGKVLTQQKIIKD